MAEYKSEVTPIKASAETVYNKLSNLEGLKQLLDKIPEDQIPADQKQLFDQIAITSDSISFPAGPVGNITLQLTQAVEPTFIKLEGVATPVPMALMLHINPSTDVSCTAQVEVDLQIPAMLKPMVSGPLKKMVEQFANMLRNLPFE